MASLFKKRYTKRDPVTGERVTRQTKKWYGKYTDPDGIEHVEPLYSDKAASAAKLNSLVIKASQRHAGLGDFFEEHRKIPLSQHREDFRTGLEAKGNSEKYVNQTIGRVERLCEACGFRFLGDFDAVKVVDWLAQQRKKELSTKTSNYYLQAIKQFGRWLVRNQRLPANTFEHLEARNAAVDIRRQRRAASMDEINRLMAAAKSGEHFRLSGPDRAMLYLAAARTGLRANELASLTPGSFDLESNPPTVTVEAGYSKRRRRDLLPIPPQLATMLRDWIATRAASNPTARLWPGSWANIAARMLRLDLKTADIPYKEPLTQRVLDFHALRHTFISHLALSGAHPKTAQKLARHSTITLTMDLYAHEDQSAMVSALDQLPTVQPGENHASDNENLRHSVKKLAPQLAQTSDFSCPDVSASDRDNVANEQKSETPNSSNVTELGVVCHRVTADVTKRLRSESNRRWRICNPLPA